ncbi:MAG: hypothetical protein Q8922_05015 [Bacteroidota bacterium]|nr:hypothetical protein [Bacteroidota bacterium]MDP4231938.1 hypothetical protein [Bacteroidota bacterium]MDP4241355.1 hypothetical protein [Bacteroidota bacterium]MDP4287278.1 hypothetical protein [Bacteroidota bacterium]
MKRSLTILLFAFGVAGCDSTSTLTTLQVVNEVAWLPDQSGMLAIIQRQTQDATTGTTSTTGGLFRVGADGTIGSQISMPDQQMLQSSYPNVIFISKNGRYAITQVGINIYRVDLQSNTATNIISNQNLLGVSPGMKYLICTETPPIGESGTRFAFVYDISSSPIREVCQPTLNGVFDSRALWLDDASFAFSARDSLRHYEVRIYDTLGTVKSTIPEALVAYHQSGYAPQANALFVYDDSGSIDRVDLATGMRTAAVVHDTVQAMDVTTSANLIAYISGGTQNPYTLYALNPQTGNRNAVASSALAVVLSPNGDRAAYLRNSGGYPFDIQVVPIAVP